MEHAPIATSRTVAYNVVTAVNDAFPHSPYMTDVFTPKGERLMMIGPDPSVFSRTSYAPGAALAVHEEVLELLDQEYGPLDMDHAIDPTIPYLFEPPRGTVS